MSEGPDGLRQFVYDQAGRLKSEVLNGQPVVHYTYGYLDKVIAVERNGKMTRFDYDAQGMLVGKQLPDGSYECWTWDGMGLVARGEERYINEGHVTGGLPLVSQTSKGVRYHQHDHLGTTVASYSTDGAVTASYDATVFGKGELEDNRTARFTGKPYDADLGAYVFPFRNYDPEAARWMSADPAGFPDGPNNHFYAAVPTMGVDPLGLWTTVTDTRNRPADTLLDAPNSLFGGIRFWDVQYFQPDKLHINPIHFANGASVTRGMSFTTTVTLSATSGGDGPQVGISASLSTSSSLSFTVGVPNGEQYEDKEFRVTFFRVPLRYRKVKIEGTLENASIVGLTSWTSANDWNIQYHLEEQ